MSDTEDTIKWQPLPSLKSEKIDDLFNNKKISTFLPFSWYKVIPITVLPIVLPSYKYGIATSINKYVRSFTIKLKITNEFKDSTSYPLYDPK